MSSHSELSVDLKKLPNLPGFTFNTIQDNYRRTPSFCITNNVRIERTGKEKAKMVKALKPTETWRTGSFPDSTTRAVFKQHEAPVVDGLVETQIPTWNALDGHVLCFSGYFKEAVVESNLENYRVRFVRLYYYLEDDTAQITEPKEDNSGMPQGQLVRRHKFPSPDGGYLKPEDLQVGGGLNVYGRCMHLTDCDGFTRAHYQELGRPQALAEEVESDPFHLTREAMKVTCATAPRTYEKLYREVMLGGGHINADMQQFLECDRKVLRFFAVMDDLKTPQFERRPFVLLFFLADDTIEIREMYPLNCGRDNFPIFFRKGKMPLGTYRVDGPQSQPRKKSDYVDGRNFFVGMEVTLLTNNKFFIYDADEFTREYFKEELGIELAPPQSVELPERAVPRAKTPPYTGYGSWEDSMSSVTHLIPKPPQKDSVKLFQHSGKILRFKAKFANPKPEDTERIFVISFFLEDDCLSIHEPPQRNLGIVTGRFLEKGVHMNQITGTLFKAEDLLPGQAVKVYNHEFLILEMDEYTKKLFTNPEHQFKDFDMQTVLEKLRESLRQQYPDVRDVFRCVDTDHDGVITLVEFKKILDKFGFTNLPESFVSTLFKHFDTRNDGQISFNEFCDTVLEEDYPMAMLATKAPVDENFDKDFTELAKYRMIEREETASVRKAVWRIGEIISKRENMVTRIFKEIAHLTHEDTVTLEQIQNALLQTGNSMDILDIERAVVHVMPDVDLNKIPYIELFKTFKTSFHDNSFKR